jgi:radical SAM peptide maturase (CXXX-repeat target family)
MLSEKLKSQLPKGPEQFMGGVAKNITLCVTEYCNFACKYCYLTNLNSKKKLSKDQAIKNIDFIFNNPNSFLEKSVIWEFIGGEPFLEIDLIDYICDILKIKMWENRKEDWFTNYMFSFSTNGSLYHKPEARKFINKNKERLSIGFSIDGVKELHDKYRVYLDGRGTFDDVIKNLDLYKEDLPGRISTKSTLSHDSLPYIFESVKFLFSLDLKVYMNVVFEEVWKDGDEEIFYKQLIKLSDWMIDTGNWKKHFVSLLDFNLISSDLNQSNKNWCGSGKMLHISTDGKLYPCTRLAPYSMTYRKEGFPIGDIEKGYDYERMSAFLNLTKTDQSCSTCMNCDIEAGCAWCTGYNYDKTGSIMKRATFICALHKARVMASKYYYEKLESLYGGAAHDKR